MKPPAKCDKCGIQTYQMYYVTAGGAFLNEEWLDVKLCKKCLEESKKALKKWAKEVTQ